MACSGCGRRSTRISYHGASAPQVEVEEDDTLSAARLTPMGWVRTCVKCGKVSEPSPFAENINKPCDCTLDE
ncbi:hypothetical protein MPK70_gp236 [Erwinia phage pEa_SNUABM_33]|uniref:Uncharacterized protein n=2 Tax=Alexandravirus TaxID=2733088 RepID=A0A384ZYI0_9CAUD|nr:hypothetical protein HOU09_gp232 [Dickeya phage vB_DsoM_AD1]YP_010302018.1 hypothetical protein MPK70_gp236 [Erwinia phage pEa_SNUABM_33]AXG67276.1 hypothetical protein AD1_232 [Dickeya phage vB_DsoM_AD1]QZE58112.1 hypothetical protein pEaSNUABM33_00236 [Erwinia phage pEa_SNUABM_33]WAK44564.1 hypothetical protein [Erwinia phage vB_Ea_2910A]